MLIHLRLKLPLQCQFPLTEIVHSVEQYDHWLIGFFSSSIWCEHVVLMSPRVLRHLFFYILLFPQGCARHLRRDVSHIEIITQSL